jgi:hypothetical protein
VKSTAAVSFAAQTLLSLIAATACGCASHDSPLPTSAQLEQNHLSFVRDGVTTREAVMLQLGIPSAQFEGERIMTYRLFFNGQTVEPLPIETSSDDPRYKTWSQPAYNLVLVFDATNRVQRHSLIKVR